MNRYTTVKLVKEAAEMARAVVHVLERRGTAIIPRNLQKRFEREFPGVRANTLSGVLAISLLSFREAIQDGNRKAGAP